MELHEIWINSESDTSARGTRERHRTTRVRVNPVGREPAVINQPGRRVKSTETRFGAIKGPSTN